MAWWLWFLVGFSLLILEMVTPGGLFALFFGAAALLVGALTGLGLGGPPWLQWLIFSVFALASLGLLRKKLRDRLNARPPAAVDTLVGEMAGVIEPITPGTSGRVELRGTTWTARNVGMTTLQAGQKAKVTAVDGLTLSIESTPS